MLGVGKLPERALAGTVARKLDRDGTDEALRRTGR